MAVKIGMQEGKVKTKPLSQMSTIEKLDAQVEKELEIEKAKKSKRSLYESIVNKRDNRIIGRQRRTDE